MPVRVRVEEEERGTATTSQARDGRSKHANGAHISWMGEGKGGKARDDIGICRRNAKRCQRIMAAHFRVI